MAPREGGKAVALARRLLRVKSLGRLGGYHHPLAGARSPARQHGLVADVVASESRVGYPPHPLAAPTAHPLHHHKVVLIPVDDGRERAFVVKLIEGHAQRGALHLYRAECPADAGHTHPLACQAGLAPDPRERKQLTMS